MKCFTRVAKTNFQANRESKQNCQGNNFAVKTLVNPTTFTVVLTGADVNWLLTDGARRRSLWDRDARGVGQKQGDGAWETKLRDTTTSWGGTFCACSGKLSQEPFVNSVNNYVCFIVLSDEVTTLEKSVDAGTNKSESSFHKWCQQNTLKCHKNVFVFHKLQQIKKN